MNEAYSKDEDEDDISDGNESTDQESEIEGGPASSRHLVRDYNLGLTEFQLLTERLSSQLNDFVIKIDLFDGNLMIRTVRGAPHGVAVGVFTQTLNSWAILRHREIKDTCLYARPMLVCACRSSVNLDRLLVRSPYKIA